MYGIPKTLDLSFLKSRRLNQICIGESQVQFNFDEAVHIYIYNSFLFVDASGITSEIRNAPSIAVFIKQLLGKLTVEINPSGKGTLEIIFNSGERLIFYDDNNAYECYEIRHGDKVIAV